MKTRYWCDICETPLRLNEQVFCDDCLERERLFIRVPKVDAAGGIIPESDIISEWFQQVELSGNPGEVR